jgi:hypothetical protein
MISWNNRARNTHVEATLNLSRPAQVCLEALARLCEASAAARRRVSRAERVYDVVNRSLKSPLWRASAKHPKSPALRALLAKAYPNYREPEASLGCRLLMHLLPCDPPPGVDLGGIGTALLILLDGTRDAKRRPIVVAATCLAMLCATANRTGLAPRAHQIFNPTSTCAYANGVTRARPPRFESSLRAIDSSKHQPNRLGCDRAREFSSLAPTSQLTG